MKIDFINSDELKRKSLKEGEVLKILDTLHLVMKCNCGRFYLENLSGKNNELLIMLKIDKDKFSQEFYGHLPYGTNPEADDLELLTKSTIFLMEVAEKIN